jgi:hypothetical protein
VLAEAGIVAALQADEADHALAEALAWRARTEGLPRLAYDVRAVEASLRGARDTRVAVRTMLARTHTPMLRQLAARDADLSAIAAGLQLASLARVAGRKDDARELASAAHHAALHAADVVLQHEALALLVALDDGEQKQEREALVHLRASTGYAALRRGVAARSEPMSRLHEAVLDALS